MSLEVALSYSEQIRQRHEAGQKADNDLRQAMLRKIEITRECGQLIADARGDLRNDEFAKATSFLDDRAIKSYLKFARTNPEPINDFERAVIAIRAALQPSGAIEFPDGHGPQQLHPANFFVKCTISIIDIAAAFKKYLARQPLNTWPPEVAEQFLESLSPIISIHRTISVWLRNH